eukprot:SAG31_NODE_2285_length_6011_cov_5.276556_4_plen_90_part_00
MLQSITIGGKPYWLLEANGHTFHFYAVDEPHSGWVCGADVHSYFLIIESYEQNPPWGQHDWRESCTQRMQEERAIMIEPAFTIGECEGS